MWPKFDNPNISISIEVITSSISQRFDQKKTIFWRVLLVNKLGLALGTTFKFYTSMVKGLKLKVRKVLIPEG